MKAQKVLLALISVGCLGVAASYPIRHYMEQRSNEAQMDALAAMREQRLAEVVTATPSAQDGEPRIMTPRPEASAQGVESGEEPAAARDAETGEEPAAARDAETGEEPAAAQSSETGEATTARNPEGGQAAADAMSPGEEQVAISADPGSVQAMPGTPAEGANAMTPSGEDQGADSAAAGAPTGEDAAPEDGRTAPGEQAEASYYITTSDDAKPGGPAPERPAPTPAPEGETEAADIMDCLPAAAGEALNRAAEKPAQPRVTPSPTPDRRIYTGALPYPEKEKVTLDESKILPELREMYDMNHDLVGWLKIPDTVVDYPVVQTENSEYYLKHDFNGNSNANGQIILDTLCDPYTPSYNLVISGHHMNSGKMFGNLPMFKDRSYWEKHRFLEFDTLMERKQFVIFAAFYSADYDEHEEGFRYNVDIRYGKETELWLKEIEANQLYDTGVDVAFGDEFITLTTCNRSKRRDGRFVVVARRLREGEWAR